MLQLEDLDSLPILYSYNRAFWSDCKAWTGINNWVFNQGHCCSAESFPLWEAGRSKVIPLIGDLINTMLSPCKSDGYSLHFKSPNAIAETLDTISFASHHFAMTPSNGDSKMGKNSLILGSMLQRSLQGLSLSYIHWYLTSSMWRVYSLFPYSDSLSLVLKLKGVHALPYHWSILIYLSGPCHSIFLISHPFLRKLFTILWGLYDWYQHFNRSFKCFGPLWREQ